jgi:hypothetical protein
VAEDLDALARTLAGPLPRSRALRVIGAAVATALIGGIRPPLARADCADTCTAKGLVLCAEPVGSFGACMKTCCDPLTTCCITHDDKGQADSAGCCAPETQDCTRRGCQCAVPCDGRCCRRDEVCSPAGCCKPELVCGRTCCEEGTRCLDAARSRCSSICKSDVGVQDYDPKQACCTQRAGVQPKYPVRDLLVCTPVQRKGALQQVRTHLGRGCPSIGENAPRSFGTARFGRACDRHLLCYAECGARKSTCDTAFHQELVQACENAYGPTTQMRDNCQAVAAAYADRAVYNGGFFGIVTGDRFFDDLQKLVCQCCPDVK